MAEIKVELTDFEYQTAYALSKRRIKTWDEKYPDQPRARQACTMEEMPANNFRGVLGELGVCKYFNVWPEITGEQDHHTFDCFIGGVKVDVKSAERHSDRLLVQVRNGQTSDAQIYILTVVQGKTVWIKGWTRKEHIILEHLITEPRPRQPCYTMPQNHPDFKMFTTTVDDEKHKAYLETWLSKSN